MEVARQHERACRRLASSRHLLSFALSDNLEGVNRELAKEEAAERDEDRRYWSPLRKELETLRHSNRGK